ncbi:uncharacterized protein LOC134782718 [Penaeus indicus]|uniref:uncharacterized protein LOC134782718 n=1 Tax=Penaeus indicus TaxID=29960 RepID=UPI00300C3721
MKTIPIIRDKRVHPATDGAYSYDVETGDGIVRHESGGPCGAQQGTLVLSMLLVASVAERHSVSYDASASRPSSPVQQIPIIRDERVHPAADGTYSFDVETGDGIVRHESGGPGGAQQGTLVLSLLLVASVAERHSVSYDASASRPSSPVQQIPIIRDERVHPAADGTYSFDVETGDGIVRHESGGPGGTQQGTVSFTFTNGQVFSLQFVADVNGYQPQSPFLPVAPAFPHPIPAHALEQIERGRLELEARAREEQRQSSSQGQAAPASHYGQP